jgi:dTDP-4-amino-4,6-dideoxygalactose transaminase
VVAKNRIFLSPPHLGNNEQLFVQDAFESNYIAPLGPQVDTFEKEFSEYTDLPHCVALSSGTAALHLTLRHLGVGPGDEVFTSSLTFIGSVTPTTFLGAIPVFIDCDRTSWNMDPDLLSVELANALRNGRLPKAVLPTDLYGQCADYQRIRKICAQYKIPLVIDAAEAMGARYRQSAVTPVPGDAGKGQGTTTDGEDHGSAFVHTGVGARAAIFSFNGNKIMTTSGGGMLASDDKALIEHCRYLSQQARDPFPHYEHSEIGYNYRMSNILAAIGRGQLRVLEDRIHRKREIFAYYRNSLHDLPGIEFMPEASHGRCTRWLTVILITPEEFGADREKVRLALEDENIESRPVWKPMHMQPVFQRTETRLPGSGKKRYPCRVVGGSVAQELFERGLCLPSGTAMDDADLERIVTVIRKCRR